MYITYPVHTYLAYIMHITHTVHKLGKQHAQYIHCIELVMYVCAAHWLHIALMLHSAHISICGCVILYSRTQMNYSWRHEGHLRSKTSWHSQPFAHSPKQYEAGPHSSDRTNVGEEWRVEVCAGGGDEGDPGPLDNRLYNWGCTHCKVLVLSSLQWLEFGVSAHASVLWYLVNRIDWHCRCKHPLTYI